MVEKKGRLIVIIVLFLCVCAVFTLQLIKLQLVDGEKYASQSQNSVITRTVVKGPRGDILDRYCRPIVQNSSAMSVEFNNSLITNVNATINTLITVFERYGEDYIDTFPISKTEPFIFSDTYTGSTSLQSSFSSYLSKKRINSNQTASDIIAALVKYYKLTDYPIERARDIIAVRYEMERRSSAYFFTFAEKISIETATAVREMADELPGVSITVEPVRSYTYENFASHTIGYIGRIYAEEYEALSGQGYALDDYIGKEGIEKVAEEYLRGTNGYKFAQTDKTGNVINIIEDIDPKVGNDVILTLDIDMQLILEASLEKIIYKLREQNGEEAAVSGAAIFMDISNAEILSIATYPTYNLATYNLDFNTLSQDPGKPYVNRAISGLFPPGSTYKMVAAVAGLEEGVVTEKTTYNCTGYYTYYDTYHLSCFGYIAHHNVTVREALMRSCNGYFADVGRLLTIDTLSHYGSLFGFGQKTGIELTGESSGVLASREYLQERGETWQAADTLLTAIGQSYTTATPLQLVNYMATIANGGTRYKPYIIKSVRDSETGELIMETSPQILEKIDIKSSTVTAIMEGLTMATTVQGGSSYAAFQDFDLVSVAVKTGTAEMPSGIPTALMLGVAPAESPQIAFVVVTENGGLNAAPINAELVKDVLSYYFTKTDQLYSIDEEGSFIN